MYSTRQDAITQERLQLADSFIGLVPRILTDVGQEQLAPRIHFELSGTKSFGASVQPHAGPEYDYRVRIHSGVLEQIGGLLAAVSTEETTLALLTDGSAAPSELLDQVVASSFAFVCLHELGHVLGGHFRFADALHLSQTETYRERDHFGFSYGEAGEAFTESRMLELEADGIAMELMVEFGAEIESLASQRMASSALEIGAASDTGSRAAIVGALLAVALLEDVRLSGVSCGTETHPFPESRVYNLFMRWLLASLPDGAVRVEPDGLEVFDAQGPGVATEILRQIESRVLPAWVFLKAVSNATACELASIRRQGYGGGFHEFVHDLRTLIVSPEEVRTTGATELVVLSGMRHALIQRLRPFREADWWKDG